VSAIELHTTGIPNLITWFNGFVGYREIQKRSNRVRAKLEGIGLESAALTRRYFFHHCYGDIVLRNRLCQPINIQDLQTNRILGFLGGIRELSRTLSDSEKERLRARVLESLNPDRDIRQLMHEIRAFVHYRQAGLTVQVNDDNGGAGFDFLVTGPNYEFELECKTFAENIGNPISIDDSVHIFRSFKAAFDRADAMNESGILTLSIPGRNKLSEPQLMEMISDFFQSAPAERNYSDYRMKFERKLDWERRLRDGDAESVAEEVVLSQEQSNSHTMVVVSKTQVLMFSIRSDQRPKPVFAIFDRLKEASGQFSKRRPAVIWGHFLAYGERQFLELVEKPRLGFRAFDVFGNYAFKSPNRRHVCRVRFSVDGDSVRTTRSGLLTPFSKSVVSGGGSAYDLTSRVSSFGPESTC
jgi:hypothetical protein